VLKEVNSLRCILSLQAKFGRFEIVLLGHCLLRVIEAVEDQKPDDLEQIITDGQEMTAAPS
jgi:hypothetical protein